MLARGIIYLLVFALFVSRLIPKYFAFTETNQVHLLGVVWEGNTALLVLIGVAVLAIVLLVIGTKNIYKYLFTVRNNTEIK